jgi:mRNA interferase HicA
LKRRTLERHLRDHGCRIIDEGGNHTRWSGPGGAGRSTVPRHREIDFRLAREICKQLGVAAPAGSR